jgi:hypothetical protein
MNEFDPEVLYSDLCGEFRRNGIAVRVLIFRLDVRSDWSLWVINATGGSFVWEHVYKTGTGAFEEFKRFVVEEGMNVFLGAGNIVPFPGR